MLPKQCTSASDHSFITKAGVYFLNSERSQPLIYPANGEPEVVNIVNVCTRLSYTVMDITRIHKGQRFLVNDLFHGNLFDIYFAVDQAVLTIEVYNCSLKIHRQITFQPIPEGRTTEIDCFLFQTCQ